MPLADEGTHARASWKRALILLLAIAAGQAVYWLAIDAPLFRSAPPNSINAIEPTEFAIARLPQPTLTALAQARFRPAEPSFTYCCDTASFASRMRFSLDKVPATGLGIISTLQVDNYQLLVNGTLIVGDGSMRPGAVTFHGQRTFLTRIPAGLLRDGVNELTYITVRDGFPYTDIYPPIIAEYNSLQRYAARRLWVMGSFPLYGALLVALAGVMAAIMAARSDDSRKSAYLSLLCAAFAANALYQVIIDPPFDGWGRMIAYFAVNLAVPSAALLFIDSWTDKPIRRLAPAIAAAYTLALAAIIGLLLGTPMPGAYDNAALVWSWYHLAFAAAFLMRMLWHFATTRDERIAEYVILSVLGVASMMEGLSLFFPNFQWMEGNLWHAAPFLVLALIVAFLARNVRLFRSQNAITTMLEAKVAAREEELEPASRRQSELIRTAAHDEERRRIMRDLHDGVGGQLMGMMLAARTGDVSSADIAERLQGTIDEMRLMVDSMDSVGESLDSALALFRRRVGPRIEDAGIAFMWDNQLPNLDAAAADGLTATYGPRETLQIFRILQEAVTNALRHAGARTISVRAAADNADGGITISVADDGVGMRDTAPHGQGIGNMHHRARDIGANLAITPAPSGGTCVTLSLNPHAAASHQTQDASA